MGDTLKWQIGPWAFDALSARLRNGEQEVPLENRAARTLEMLCQHRGRPVSRDEILAHVWEGRAVSANSVAIVIANLRRALGDDASEPRYIATVPKRGYRLTEELAGPTHVEKPAPPAAYRTRPTWAAVLLVVLLLAVTGLLVARSRNVEPSTVLVERVSNDTGSAQYQPLATALQELITNRLSAGGIKVISPVARVDERGLDRLIRFRSKLILWNEIPTLSMQATDKTGFVSWSAMAEAPPKGLASATISKLVTFERTERSRLQPSL